MPTGNISNEQFSADLKRNQAKAANFNAREVLAQLLATLGKVDFSAEMALEQGDGSPKQKHMVVLIVQKVLEAAKAKKWGLCRQHDFIYCYNAKYWQVIDKDELKAFLGKAAEKMGYKALEARYHKFRDELYKQFLCAALLPAPPIDNNRVLINLINGTFHITSSKQDLKPHKETDFLRYILPFEYDRAATCPIFLKYLERVLPDSETRDVLAEYIGYVFTRNLKLEKLLLLYGSGANGKSVFFEVINALLGKENISNYSLSNLSEEHNRAQIVNKLLNYGSEVKAGIEPDLLKALASVEPIQARLKHGNSFIMENYAKLAFNCNELPKDIEHNEAYFRRFLIIPFEVLIPEEDRDPNLAPRIINNELPGVFNWVLAGLKRLLGKSKFSECKKVRDILEAYRLDSDSTWSFIEDAGYQSDLIKWVTLKELYQDYKIYCIDSGYKALSIRKFAERIRKHGFKTEKRNFGQVVLCAKR